MNKKIPMRQCVGCGEMKNKKEMMRVIKTAEDQIVLDVTGKKNGRGAYLCISEECLKKADMTMDNIDAIAVTYGPGLIGCSLIGVEAATTISYMYNKPLIPVHHIAGHIYHKPILIFCYYA